VNNWTRLSPSQFISIDAASDPWFKDISETYLRKDGNYDVIGIGMDQLRDAASRGLYDYLNTDSGMYNFE